LGTTANLVTAFFFGVIGTIGFAVFGRDTVVTVYRKDTRNKPSQ
jgi:capsular polysaccharide biosynthesis protein